MSQTASTGEEGPVSGLPCIPSGRKRGEHLSTPSAPVGKRSTVGALQAVTPKPDRRARQGACVPPLVHYSPSPCP